MKIILMIVKLEFYMNNFTIKHFLYQKRNYNVILKQIK